MKSANKLNVIANRGHFDIQDSIALGCTTCAFATSCGGFSANGVAYDCRSLCCGLPSKCRHVVCPEKKNEHILRYMEVNGFDLDDVRIAKTATPPLPSYLPLIDSSARRSETLGYETFVVPITAGIRTGQISSREVLAERFLISPESHVIFNGVGQDKDIEPLWTWITSRDFGGVLKALNPVAMWTPNFSTFADAPRTNDLHSIKRIAICAERIAAAGVAPILHLNGRTPDDYLRWGKFLESAPINFVAFEFRSMRKARKDFHCDQLCRLADRCQRPLTLLVRAGGEMLTPLIKSFCRTIVVDTIATRLCL